MVQVLRFVTLISAINLLSTSLPVRAEDCAFKTPPNISIGKELFITDLSVVNDARATGPDGAWSFGRLMTAMVSDKHNAGAFVKDWLRSWENTTRINNFQLDARPVITEKITRPWMTKDHAPTIDEWVPNFANAPFRLLAIVYRPDLGIINKNGVIVNAGEARLVFTAIDLAKEPDPEKAPPLPFTLIFEYTLPASDRHAVKVWAERWHALGQLPYGARFNAELQHITDMVSLVSSNNMLVRLRTNEGLDIPWQLREFNLDSRKRRLSNAPVHNTPHLSLLDHPSELSAYINNNRGDDIPIHFIGGNADIPDRTFHWPQMDISNNVLRHNFAMLTCNGCHAAETGRKADETDIAYAGFRHISGRRRNAEATLSEFLTGNPAIVIDPTGKLQTFCDLKMRQKAMFEALHPRSSPTAISPHPDDLSVARSRQDRTD